VADGVRGKHRVLQEELGADGSVSVIRKCEVVFMAVGGRALIVVRGRLPELRRGFGAYGGMP
jgi:hypothetical protein